MQRETRVTGSKSACADRSPTRREMESAWIAHLRLWREQRCPGHTARTSDRKWSVLAKFGCGKYLQRLGRLCEGAPAVTGPADCLFQSLLGERPLGGKEEAAHQNTDLRPASLYFVLGFKKGFKCPHSQVYFVFSSLQPSVFQ